MSLANNRPAFEYHVIGQRHLDGSVEIRLQALMSTGELATIQRWRGQNGRIDAGQLADLKATIGGHIGDSIITVWGVQTVLR